jgi:Co/Zn/Cd efflux system component
MEQETQSNINTYVGLLSFIVSLGLGFYTFFIRSEDKSSEYYEKQSEYRTQIKKDIQSIKDLHMNQLQAHKNVFQSHLLSNQREISELNNKINTLIINFDNLKRQNEYLHSQYKLADAAIKAELRNEFKKK